MNELIKKSNQIQAKAREVIQELKIIESWETIGARVNPVGSFEMELMMNNYDIDFHIYSDKFSIEESFKAVSKIAANSRIKKINYTNLVEEEDRCLEWHAFYEAENHEIWQIDMIHILNDSPYVGHFEKVAKQIKENLTQEKKISILEIKNSIPGEENVMGIEIYKAVFEANVKNYPEFKKWKKENKNQGIITWMP